MHRRLGSEGEHNTTWLKNSVWLGLQMQGSGREKSGVLRSQVTRAGLRAPGPSSYDSPGLSTPILVG